MSKPVKIILGLLSVAPLVSIVLFYIKMWQTISNYLRDEESWQLLYTWPWASLVLWGFTLAVVLIAVFIVLNLKQEGATSAEKTYWTIALLFLNYLALPVFWYRRIWRAQYIFEQKITERRY